MFLVQYIHNRFQRPILVAPRIKYDGNLLRPNTCSYTTTNGRRSPMLGFSLLDTWVLVTDGATSWPAFQLLNSLARLMAERTHLRTDKYAFCSQRHVQCMAFLEFKTLKATHFHDRKPGLVGPSPPIPL